MAIPPDVPVGPGRVSEPAAPGAEDTGAGPASRLMRGGGAEGRRRGTGVRRPTGTVPPPVAAPGPQPRPAPPPRPASAAMPQVSRPQPLPDRTEAPTLFIAPAKPQRLAPSTPSYNPAPGRPAEGSASDAGQPEGGKLGPGSRLARFVIERELGRGAMGVVYLARQDDVERDVAIKILPPALNIDEDAVGRFQREAKAISRLAHPGIIRLYDYGFDQNTYYYAMEVVTGRDLAELIRSERPAYVEAARITARIAEALDYAHNMGVLHRDIKPANILLDARNEPRLTDFGLARLDSNSSLTVDGAILGTPLYMPPEQAGGERGISKQADIYSLGATLYELATGSPPYTGKDAREILLQVLRDAPPAPQVRDPHIPKDLASIISRAMAREARDRYASAREFASDLQSYIAGQPVAIASKNSWKSAEERRATALFGIAAFVVIALLSGFGMSLLNRPSSASGRKIAELQGQLSALQKQRGAPTAATPDLDRETGAKAFSITNSDRDRARLLAGDRNIYTRNTIRTQRRDEVTPDLKAKAKNLVSEARTRKRDGDIPGAGVLLREAQNQDPRNPDAPFELAILAAEQHQPQDAIALLSLFILDFDGHTELRERARLERARAYCDLGEAPTDVLAEEDFATVTGTLSWKAQIELVKLHVLRQRFELAYLTQEDLMKRIREAGIVAQGLVSKDELADIAIRQTQLALKLSKPLAEARGILATAQEMATDATIRARIDEVAQSIDEAAKTP